jgi:hypothetical protein
MIKSTDMALRPRVTETAFRLIGSGFSLEERTQH